ncbi:MAG TPA: transcription antitermination factor NusB, partial [Kofleriaceae bacterium]|nr:transcription antitermination factor NusB [Kofleriaceae bacterium]
ALTHILRIGAYQILFLERVPAHAAVSAAAGAARRVGGARMAGFVNGLLRRLAERGEPPLPDREVDPAAYARVAFSLPEWLWALLADAVAEPELFAVAEALAEPPPLWARINPLAGTAENLATELAARSHPATLEPSPLCPGAVILRGLGSGLRAEPTFARGLWTVQDIAAQLVCRLMGARPGEHLLDACAGVGGKSGALAEQARNLATIDAADSSPQKLALGEAAMARLGIAGVTPIACDLTAPGAAIAEAYDGILLDAPCSGLGVVRRHPELKWRRDPQSIAALAALQARLLEALVPRLRPGGRLVYSVCTFSREEGRDQIAALLLRHPELAVAPPPPSDIDWSGLVDSTGAITTTPTRHGGDLFYAVRLERRP